MRYPTHNRRLNEPGGRLLKAAVQQLQLSARPYHRVFDRIIVGLACFDHVETSQLARALEYRPREWG